MESRAYDGDGKPRDGAFVADVAGLLDLSSWPGRLRFIIRRRRVRCEDRIRIAKDTGLRILPLHDLTQNQIWLAIVALACEITAWLRNRPWAGLLITAITRLRPAPATG